MQTIKYIANRRLATDYLKIAYQSTSIHNEMLVATPMQANLLATHNIDHPLSTKQLRFFQNDFNIMRTYQNNRNKVINKIHQFKRLINLLFTYRVLGGYKNVSNKNLYAYSMLITSNKHNFTVSANHPTYYRVLNNNNNSIAVSNANYSNTPNQYAYYQIKDNTNNAIIHIHNAISKLKKRLSRIHLPLKVIDDSLVVKFGDVVNPVFPHIHAILLGSNVDTVKLSNQFSNKLSKYLGYDVNCSIHSLINKANKTPVVIDNTNYNYSIDDKALRSGKEYLSKYPMNRYNPYYAIGFTMLYINKTKDLSFIGGSHGKRYNHYSNDLQRWEQLPLSTKQKYIFGTFNSIHIKKYISDSLHQNINFISKRKGCYGIQINTYGIRTHLFYQFKRRITKLTKLIHTNQMIHDIATLSIRINTVTIQTRTLTATVAREKRIFSVREAIHQFKIDYTYHTIEMLPRPYYFTVKKHSLTITFTKLGIHHVEPFRNNFVISLFNSS